MERICTLWDEYGCVSRLFKTNGVLMIDTRASTRLREGGLLGVAAREEWQEECAKAHAAELGRQPGGGKARHMSLPAGL